MTFYTNGFNINSGPRPPFGANVVFVPRPPHIPAGTVQRVDHITGQNSWHFPADVTSHLAKIPLPSLPDTPISKKLVPINQPSSSNKWACRNCTYDNLIIATECYICDTPNIDKRVTIPPPKLSKKSYEDKPGCMECSYLNGRIFKECKKCRTVPSAPPYPILSESKHILHLSWECIGCTYINNKSNTCEICKCPKVLPNEDKPRSQLILDRPKSYSELFLDYLVFGGRLYLIYSLLMLALTLIQIFL